MFRNVGVVLLFLLPSAVCFSYFGISLSVVSISFSEIFLVTIAYLLLSSRRHRRRFVFRRDRSFLLFLLFVFVVFLSYLVNEKTFEGLLMTVRFVEMLLFYYVLILAFSAFRYSRNQFYYSLVFSGVLVSLFVLFQVSTGYGLTFEMALQNANDKEVDIAPGKMLLGAGAGAAPAMAILCVLSDWKQLGRVSAGLIILVCFVSLILIDVRTWLISMLIAILVLAGLKKFLLGVVAVFLALTVLGVMFVVAGLDFVVSNEMFVDLLVRLGQMMSILFGGVEDTSLGPRFFKWYSAWTIFLNNFLFGAGPENLDLGMMSWDMALGNMRSDSQLFDLLAMFGIGGGAAVLAFLLPLIKVYIRGNGTVASAMVLMWLVTGLSWHIFYGYVGILFIFVFSGFVFFDLYERGALVRMRHSLNN